MRKRVWLASLWVILGLLLAACQPGSGNSSAGGASTTAAPAGTAQLKRIAIGARQEADTRPTARGPSIVIQALVRSGLSVRDGEGTRHAILAQDVPSLENGLWTLEPDGTMQTTYRLRPNASWHDGTPFTAADVAFSLQVGRDRTVTALNDIAYASIDDVTVVDPATVVVSWTRPFIDADGLLGDPALGPLPAHLLTEPYRSDPSSLLDLSYWTQDFVGTGPFKVKSWNPGVDVQLEANDQFVLGRPKLDEIDLRFIPDENTLLANFLAGTLDASSMLGSSNDGLTLREQWSDGTVAFNLASGVWVALFPQFIDPSPAAIADLRFRTAMVLAIDRQAIADATTGGISPVPQSFLSPNQPQYAPIEATLPHYDYDPQHAAQILEGMGYARGADRMYRDAAGQPLEVDLLSAPSDQSAKPATMIASYWQQLGVASTATANPPQRVNDYQYLATWPGYLVFPRPNDVEGIHNYVSSNTMLPANGYRVSGPGNTSRYMSPELDTLIDTYFATIPKPERLDVLGRIVHITTDQLTAAGLFYYSLTGAFSHRLQGVSTQWWNQTLAWNAQEWDLK